MINISIDLDKIDLSKMRVEANGRRYYDLCIEKKKTPDNEGNDIDVYERHAGREKGHKRKCIGHGKTQEPEKKKGITLPFRPVRY